MYAVGHTMQNVYSLSTEGERKIREQQAKSKKKFKGVFYRCVIKMKYSVLLNRMKKSVV